MKKQHRSYGFTLIELLIVIALLGFLSITGLSMFQGSQKRARDNRRKTDLGQIAKALEMYTNDYGYPTGSAGKIVGCGETTAPATACSWGSAWNRTKGTTVIVYMQKLPKDPGSGSYCYQSPPPPPPTLNGYKLFAQLEGDDPDKLSTPVVCNTVSYNYVLRSSNLLPTQ